MRLQRDASGDFILESEFLSERLGTPADALRRRMQLGQVTSRVEQGVGADAGRIRLVVRLARRMWSAILDENGEIVEETIRDVADKADASPAERSDRQGVSP
jgi:hypothetical protein